MLNFYDEKRGVSSYHLEYQQITTMLFLVSMTTGQIFFPLMEFLVKRLCYNQDFVSFDVWSSWLSVTDANCCVYKVHLLLLVMSRNAEAFLRKLINDTLVDDSNSVFKIDSRYCSLTFDFVTLKQSLTYEYIDGDKRARPGERLVT
ncbi:hypothetical protein T11_1951 [Trichinella zimbabwensis]|uniref:Uncharacterized protein n=1 Tax=Trichinella zimbabwensis TaxID=268475 RepID=A0A0V1H8S2_9BILA|nr:hypothetical protein T11_1951 [Trichinella zimbabwensis]